MANVAGKMDWAVNFTTEEFRLVLKALGGRLKPEEVEDAKKLGDYLTKLRASFSKSLQQQMDHLMDVVEKKEEK